MNHWVQRLQLGIGDPVFAANEARFMRSILMRGGESGVDMSIRYPAVGETVSIADQALLVSMLQQDHGHDLADRLAWRFGLEAFGSAGRAVMNARDLRDAVLAINAFAPLLNVRHHVELRRVEAGTWLELSAFPGISGATIQILLAHDIAKLRRFLDDKGCVSRAYAAPEGLARIFVADGNATRLRATGAKRAKSADAEYARAKTLMDDLCDRHLPCAIRRLVSSSPSERPPFAVIADRLGFSCRTLRRRLSEFRISYTAICDEVIQARALELVNDGGLTACSIAAVLGYSDDASFRRAFRRWTGMSPGKFSSRTRQQSQTPGAQPCAATLPAGFRFAFGGRDSGDGSRLRQIA